MSQWTRIGVVGIVFFALVATVAEAICVPPAPAHDPLVAYIASYVESLAYADEAIQRGNSLGRTASEGFEALVQTLTNLELVARDYECAANVFGKSTNNPFSPTLDDISRKQHDLATRTAEVAYLAYLALAQKNRERAKLLDGLLKGSEKPEEMPSAVARISADTTEILGTFPTVSVMITHLLVDPTPGPTGRMDGVRVTRQQRDDLLKLIGARFGNRATKFVAGTPYVEAAAALLRQFLAQDGWRYRR